MSDINLMTSAESVAPGPDTDSRGRPLSDSVKRCERCGTHARMAVISATSYTPSHFQRLLLRIVAPGGVELNRTYECPRCGHQIHDLSFSEAVLAPLMIITAMVLAMIAFLLFVFFVARA